MMDESCSSSMLESEGGQKGCGVDEFLELRNVTERFTRNGT
jgi:hypothetical protein